MKFSVGIASVLGFIAGAKAGTVIWNGSFNNYPTVSTFDNWSWSNEVGAYQWYIHGTQPTSHYLALDPTFKNPADTAETNGLRMTIDSTATWNSQMERVELIPQTTQNLGQGELFYHFSIMQNGVNSPDPTLEHQIFFFESHFTQLKFGVGPNPSDLQWMVGSDTLWSAPFSAGTWFNFAYDIDFSAGTVGLWASTGSAPLTKVVQNVAASTSTNSEDFHVGILRIVNGPGQEDYYVSGVYIEQGPITTAIGSGAAPPPPTGPSGTTSVGPTSVSSASHTSSSTVSSSSAAPGPQQSQYGQCGGTGYTGPTTCVAPYTCKAISAPYYYQCL
ncbi:carbohydrate-binding module family 1 protein [Phanerochaete sordida]|uniref:Carbohydrate-binding module family 1 protein n=1 Tax=Phanerochaete sordida TaxID=48140 RepID=A0A9P3LKM9_9APHY|nr:carbohydrate-binding module family 1 protein [Phanerochaete sordida]